MSAPRGVPDNDLDEALADSFPASDALSFTGMHLGPPAHAAPAPGAAVPARRRARSLVLAAAAAAGIFGALLLRALRKRRSARWWRG